MAVADITKEFEIEIEAPLNRRLSGWAEHGVILPIMGQHHSPEGGGPDARDFSAAERWSRVREILNAALRLGAGDAAMQSEVESLIQYSEQSGMIDRPALASMVATATMEPGTGPGAPLAAGQKVSHYEIAGKIGEGGRLRSRSSPAPSSPRTTNAASREARPHRR